MSKMQERKGMLLQIAELIDAFRVVPRLILIVYGYLVWYVIQWFLAIPNPTTGQTALVTTLAGSVSIVIGLYQHSGRRWGQYGNRNLGSPRMPKYNMAPTIVMPPVQPNINIGHSGVEPEVPERGGPAGRSAGPYDESDFYDGPGE